MSLEIELKSSTRVIDSLNKLGFRIPEAMAIAIKQALLLPEIYIKQEELSGQLLNVVTGNLRASVNSRPVTIDGKTIYGRVKAGGWGKDKEVYYAKYLEEGTRKIRARHFMKKGLFATKEKIRYTFEEKLYELARKWGAD